MKNGFTQLLSLAFIFASLSLVAQQKPSPPATAQAEIDGVNVTINYHQPSAKGRTIMGELVPYGKVWRTGANDATTIMFDQDVEVEGKPLAAGTYALFTIPGEKEWTIIFNKNAKQWGAFSYKESEDALRVQVESEKTSEFVETFTINIHDEKITLMWENTEVEFEVEN